MKLEDMLIMLIVLGVVMSIFLGTLHDLRTSYGLNVTTAEKAQFEKLNSTTTKLVKEAKEIERNVSSNLGGAKTSTLDDIAVFINAAFGSVRNIGTATLNGPIIAYSVIQASAEGLGISLPAVLLPALMSLLAIGVSFAIISALFKYPT